MGVAKSDRMVFAVVTNFLNLESGWNLARISDGNLFGLTFANQNSIKVDWGLVQSNERVLSDGGYLQWAVEFLACLNVG